MVYSLFLQKSYHLQEVTIDRLVSDGQNLSATGHLGHVVTTTDKSLAIRASAYESIEESSSDIRHKTTVLVASMLFPSNHRKNWNKSTV